MQCFCSPGFFSVLGFCRFIQKADFERFCPNLVRFRGRPIQPESTQYFRRELIQRKSESKFQVSSRIRRMSSQTCWRQPVLCRMSSRFDRMSSFAEWARAHSAKSIFSNGSSFSSRMGSLLAEWARFLPDELADCRISSRRMSSPLKNSAFYFFLCIFLKNLEFVISYAYLSGLGSVQSGLFFFPKAPELRTQQALQSKLCLGMPSWRIRQAWSKIRPNVHFLNS